ncbi:heparinase II/III family protein [Prosthecomicrobium sp. N25]|uniref:heparinase II/III family protein n=1 Tax=Prosthecomicrobium sp. N25 TaxID=3129254 RepID=UPI0030777D77
MTASRLVAVELGRRWTVALVRTGRRATRAFQPVADRIAIAHQDIRTADPTVAADIHVGRYVFAGRAVDADPRSPFEVEPPSAGWARQLHGFGWLRHLRAADHPAYREDARRLVEDWLRLGQRAPFAWEEEVAARRLLSWLAHSPMLIDGCDAEFYQALLDAVTTHTRFLRDHIDRVPPGLARIRVAVALLAAAVSVESFRKLVRLQVKRLDEELSRQIFPDGGHVGRNPSAILEILVDLLPVREVQAARGIPVSPVVMSAIDRMMHLLRFFRHGDGALALFNGAGATSMSLLASVLVYDDARSRPPGNAPHSGYQRLEAEGTIVIIDCGTPPPPGFSREAHAGCLSFEMSSGRQRLIVNCGAFPLSPEWRELARSTAAHSTACLADRSSATFAAGAVARMLGPVIVDGPRTVFVDRQEHEGAVAVIAGHDGYEARFGILHERTLRLAPQGDRLDGRDRLFAEGRVAAPVPYAIRFHLHPNIRVSALEPGIVMLLAPDGESWEFHAPGHAVRIEDSVFLADPHGARRTQQLVIEGTTPAEIRWTLVRATSARDARRG